MTRRSRFFIHLRSILFHSAPRSDMSIRGLSVTVAALLWLVPRVAHADRSSGVGAEAPRSDTPSQGSTTGASPAVNGKEPLPEAFRKPPFSKQSLSVGSPNHGRLVRGRRLPHEPALKLLKAANEHAYAHPLLIKAVLHAAKSVRHQFPGSTLSVVDASSKDGGLIRGKRSHQSGRDIDLLFFAFDKKGKRSVEKKIVRYDGIGKAIDGSGARFDDERNWALLESLADQKDSPVTHVFVDARLRQKLMAYAESSGKKSERVARVAALLFVGDDREPADAYFHVRVRCPSNEAGLCDESPR